MEKSCMKFINLAPWQLNQMPIYNILHTYVSICSAPRLISWALGIHFMLQSDRERIGLLIWSRLLPHHSEPKLDYHPLRQNHPLSMLRTRNHALSHICKDVK